MASDERASGTAITSPLHGACRDGDLDLVRKLVVEASDDTITCSDEDGNTPLHIAAQNGHLPIVQELASRYSTPSAGKNAKGQTSLHLASARGHTKVVEALAHKFPSDLTERDNSGWDSDQRALVIARDSGDTPLHLAVLHGQTDTVELLLKQFQCNPHSKGYRGRTVLHHACSGGHLKLVESLITEYGCDPLAPEDYGHTPLHCAAFYGHVHVLVELFNKYNCPPHQKGHSGCTVLHQACAGGHLKLARTLVSEYGLNPLDIDDTGKSALHWAAMHSFMTVSKNKDPLAHAGDFHSRVDCATYTDTIKALITEYKCAVDSKDSDGDTALHLAALAGSIEVVSLLISEFGCSPSVKGFSGRTPLHQACDGGYLGLVEKLILEYSCDPMSRGDDGQTPLHKAASEGHVGVVRVLLSEFGADVAAQDKDCNTTLHLAALYGHTEVVSVLISEFGCSPSVKGQCGQTPLHAACNGGHLGLVEKLILEYSCDLMSRDDDGDTPLHIAALYGREEVVRELVRKYKCPVDCVNSDGQTPLHLAAMKGHVGVVRILLSEFGADVAVRNKNDDTALNLAALNGHTEVVSVLISEFGCSPSVKGQYGRTLLHQACDGGHLGLVEKLITEYNCNLMAEDEIGNIPLHIAALAGREEVVRTLITKHGCFADSFNFYLKTPLHLACEKGHSSTVQVLVQELGANPAALDIGNDTLLDIAAKESHREIVKFLEKEVGSTFNVPSSGISFPLHQACEKGDWNEVEKLVSEKDYDPMARDSMGRTPLHVAARAGHVTLVKNFVSGFKPIIMCLDDDGNTPLHIAALCNRLEIIRVLVRDFGCFPFIINKRSKTPLQLAAERGHQRCVTELSRHACNEVSKVLVIGNKHSGKTTLLQTLKAASGYPTLSSHAVFSLFRHISNQVEAVTFFELNSDPVVQAPVAERLVTTCCTAVILTDLSKDRREVLQEVGSWLTFLSYSSKGASTIRVLIVGSHADILSSRMVNAKDSLQQIFLEISQSVAMKPLGNIKLMGCFALNCCSWPNSEAIQKFKSSLIQAVAAGSSPSISPDAVNLLQVLERDFQNKPIYHIKEMNEHLSNTRQIYPEGESDRALTNLKELDSHGFVLLTEETGGKSNQYVVVNLSFLLQTFAFLGHRATTSSHFSMGVVAETELNDLIPGLSYLPIKQCLKQLHLCQDTDDLSALELFHMTGPLQNIDNTQKWLFFPSLITSARQNRQWWIQPKMCTPFCQGFYFRAVPSEYVCNLFSSRFFQTLSLRLASISVFSYSQSSRTTKQCMFWKNGIQWLLENGVEVVVEAVDKENGVAVLARSGWDCELECVNVLSAVVQVVLQTKAEFCCSLQVESYLLHPADVAKDSIPEINTVTQFKLNAVQAALNSPGRGQHTSSQILSVDGSTVLPENALRGLHNYTLWNLLFPLNPAEVHAYLSLATERWWNIGRELGVPKRVLWQIEKDHPGDHTECSRRMVQKWLNSPHLKPCWYFLVDALHRSQMDHIAGKILFNYDIQVELQKQLLDENNENTDVDNIFLQMLADAVGATNWSCFASHLPVSPDTRLENSSLSDLLQEWKKNAQPTYGDMFCILRTTYLCVPLYKPAETIECVRKNIECKLLNSILPEILTSCPIHTTTIDWNEKEEQWDDIGCSLRIPPGAVPHGQTVKLAVMCRLSGPFVLPEGVERVSPVYLLVTSPEIQFMKKVQLSLHHWARIENEQSCSNLVFMSAPNNLDNPDARVLKPVQGGLFLLNSCIGTIQLDHFSPWSIGWVIEGVQSFFTQKGHAAAEVGPVGAENQSGETNTSHVAIQIDDPPPMPSTGIGNTLHDTNATESQAAHFPASLPQSTTPQLPLLSEASLPSLQLQAGGSGYHPLVAVTTQVAAHIPPADVTGGYTFRPVPHETGISQLPSSPAAVHTEDEIPCNYQALFYTPIRADPQTSHWTSVVAVSLCHPFIRHKLLQNFEKWIEHNFEPKLDVDCRNLKQIEKKVHLEEGFSDNVSKLGYCVRLSKNEILKVDVDKPQDDQIYSEHYLPRYPPHIILDIQRVDEHSRVALDCPFKLVGTSEPCEFKLTSPLFGAHSHTVPPNSETSLHTPKLTDLIRLHVRNWYTLGLELGIRNEELSSIQKSNHYRENDCRREMFALWLRSGSRTYENLVKALYREQEIELVQQICSNYGIPHPRWPQYM